MTVVTSKFWFLADLLLIYGEAIKTFDRILGSIYRVTKVLMLILTVFLGDFGLKKGFDSDQESLTFATPPF